MTAKATYDAALRELDRLTDLHECTTYDTVVETPGFNGTGISLLTCPECRPLVTGIIRRHYGDADVHPWPTQPATQLELVLA